MPLHESDHLKLVSDNRAGYIIYSDCFDLLHIQHMGGHGCTGRKGSCELDMVNVVQVCAHCPRSSHAP